MAGEGGSGVGNMLRNLFPGIGIEGAPVNPPPAGPNPPPVDPSTGLPLEPGPGDPSVNPPAVKFNPVTGEPIKDPAASPESKDPLAHFADLFDNKKQAENLPAPVVNSQDLFTKENMGKILESLPAFTDHISEETRAAIAKGDDPNAIGAALNEVGQGAYAAALQHAVRLSETLTAKQMERMESTFSDRINQHQVNQSITQHDLIKDSPVLQAGISIIAERLQKTNPSASADWITQEATKYFLESAKVLSGGAGDDGQPGGSGDKNPVTGAEVDWVDFATTDGRDQQ